MPAHFDLALRGGLVWNQGALQTGDLGIAGGRLAAVGEVGPAAEEVSVAGLALLPGAIDSQVHFREPGLTHKEDLETGSRAAVLGGVTSFLDEPNTNPTTTTEAALRQKIQLAAGRCWCDYGFWVGASTENLDELAQLEALPHTPGIGEVFMASSTGPLLVPDDASLLRVLQNGRHRVAVHAEDEEVIVANRAHLGTGRTVEAHPEIRSVESSVRATRRIIALSQLSRRPVHVLHVSSAEELPLLEDAKRAGLGTTCEVTPQHLVFSDEEYAGLGTRIQMNTPIRSRRHRDALRAATAAGLFDVAGSDHAPHTLEEKSAPYPASPSGMPGVQTMLPTLLDLASQGVFGLPTVVRLLSENPARLFRLPLKGRLEPGADADVVAVDLDADTVVEAHWLAYKCGWSPLEGRRLRGRVVHTIVRGGWAVRDGQPGEAGLGRPLDFAP